MKVSIHMSHLMPAISTKGSGLDASDTAGFQVSSKVVVGSCDDAYQLLAQVVAL
jgi:hypothetical protein